MSKSSAEVEAVEEAIGKERFAELLKYFGTGHLCLADLARIPQNEIENLHHLACQHLLRKDYVQAEKVIRMVVNLYPSSAEFWGTYGMVFQYQGKWLQARIGYAAAAEIDKQKPDWLVHGAECELMLQHPQFALDLVKQVFHLKSSKAPSAVEMFKRAQRIKVIAEQMEPGPGDLAEVKVQSRARA
jgi:tetratricopeptide (TPR) repeat protein